MFVSNPRFGNAASMYRDRFGTLSSLVALTQQFIVQNGSNGAWPGYVNADQTQIQNSTATGISLLTALSAVTPLTAIGAGTGTSNFSGAYSALTGLPTLGSASANASTDFAAAAGTTAALANKADLDNTGKVPAAQLPAYVDDVVEYATFSAFPATGAAGLIYVALDTNLIYRWGGSVYVVLDPSLALGNTSATAFRGDLGKNAYDLAQNAATASNLTSAWGTANSAYGLANTTSNVAANAFLQANAAYSQANSGWNAANAVAANLANAYFGALTDSNTTITMLTSSLVVNNADNTATLNVLASNQIVKFPSLDANNNLAQANIGGFVNISSWGVINAALANRVVTSNVVNSVYGTNATGGQVMIPTSSLGGGGGSSVAVGHGILPTDYSGGIVAMTTDPYLSGGVNFAAVSNIPYLAIVKSQVAGNVTKVGFSVTAVAANVLGGQVGIYTIGTGGGAGIITLAAVANVNAGSLTTLGAVTYTMNQAVTLTLGQLFVVGVVISANGTMPTLAGTQILPTTRFGVLHTFANPNGYGPWGRYTASQATLPTAADYGGGDVSTGVFGSTVQAIQLVVKS